MTKKKTTLINETVIRRWGKLANMPALTENFLDTLEEEEEEEMGMEAEDEAPYRHRCGRCYFRRDRY